MQSNVAHSTKAVLEIQAREDVAGLLSKRKKGAKYNVHGGQVLTSREDEAPGVQQSKANACSKKPRQIYLGWRRCVWSSCAGYHLAQAVLLNLPAQSHREVCRKSASVAVVFLRIIMFAIFRPRVPNNAEVTGNFVPATGGGTQNGAKQSATRTASTSPQGEAHSISRQAWCST